jgi:hypothetical protein
MICPQCGYNLRGLTESRCPECGLNYDRNALRQIAADSDMRKMRFAYSAMGLAAVGVVLILAGDRPSFWSSKVIFNGLFFFVGCFGVLLRMLVLVACVWVLTDSLPNRGFFYAGFEGVALFGVTLFVVLILVPMSPLLFHMMGLFCLLGAWYQRLRSSGDLRHSVDNVSPSLRWYTARVERRSWVVLCVGTGISLWSLLT